jgi:uncharacterized protein YecT (DUF1311 family)
VTLLPKVLLLSTLLLLCGSASAQASQSSDDAGGKDASKKAWQDYLAQIQTLKMSARSAYGNEQKRETTGDCPSAATTYDISVCLGQEIEKTTANYRVYLTAIRSVEGLPAPDEVSAKGPRVPLSPVEAVKEFDEAESAWQVYEKAQCSTAYDIYRSGTIAPLMQLTCELRLLRDRMKELESIYQITENR